MPILSYKTALAAKVKDGSKKHTIRFSKRPWKVGDLAYHATGVRTRYYDNFRTDEVTRVDPISIRIFSSGKKAGVGAVTINDITLDSDTTSRLSENDGFDATRHFFAFFACAYGKSRVLTGQLIHWSAEPIDYAALAH